jgi:hypothetical protein
MRTAAQVGRGGALLTSEDPYRGPATVDAGQDPLFFILADVPKEIRENSSGDQRHGSDFEREPDCKLRAKYLVNQRADEATFQRIVSAAALREWFWRGPGK